MTGWSSGCTGEVRNDTTAKSIPKKAQPTCSMSDLRHIFRDWSVNKYPISDEEVAQYVKAYAQPGALRGGFNYYRAAADEDPPQWQADAQDRKSTRLNSSHLVISY